MKLTATPEQEDFLGKYEKSGKLGDFLVGRYFNAVDELIKIALKQSGINVALEIGCGSGYSTQKLRKSLPKNVKLQASEYVERQIPIAKKLNPGIRIIQEDAYNLKRKDGEIDLIFLLEVLEHLDHPKKALAEIKRTSSRGGYLILGVPREPLWRILNFSRGKYWSSWGNTPGHLNHWSTAAIVKFVEANYGKVIEVEKPLPWILLLAQKNPEKRR